MEPYLPDSIPLGLCGTTTLKNHERYAEQIFF